VCATLFFVLLILVPIASCPSYTGGSGDENACSGRGEQPTSFPGLFMALSIYKGKTSGNEVRE